MAALATIRNIEDVRREKGMNTKPMTVKRYWKANGYERYIINQKIKSIKKEMHMLRAILILGIVYAVAITLLNKIMFLSGGLQIALSIGMTIIYNRCADSQWNKFVSRLRSLYISNPLYDIDKTGKEVRIKDSIPDFSNFVTNTAPISSVLYYVLFGYIALYCLVNVVSGIQKIF